MARTITGGQRTQLQSRNTGVWLRVLIQNGAGTYIDYSGVNSSDYRLSATVTSSLDQIADTATVVLRAGKGTASIAPAMTGATVNATTRAIDVGRGMRIDVATLAPTATPISTDWVRIFEGTIDTVKATNNGETLTLAGRNLMAPLLKATFGTATAYGDRTTALQTVLASMLSGALASPPTIVTPVSPAWAPARLAVKRGETFWSAASTMLDQIGWMLRYRWNGNTPELRLFAPTRAPSAADFTLSSIEVRDVQAFDFDYETIRNQIQVTYRSGGVATTVTSQDGASITAYGTLPMYVVEASASQITDGTTATRMADAILADLKTPVVSHQITTIHPFWCAEVGDVIDVPSNTVTHDATQRLAVVGVTHTLERGGGYSTLTMRGAPASRGRSWLAVGGGETQLELPSAVVCRVTSSTPTSVTVTVTNEPAGGVVRYLGGTATRTAGPLANVDSAEGTTWTFSKPTSGGDLEALFSGTVNGLTDTDSVTIGRDTIAVLTRARILSDGPTTMTVRVSASAPGGVRTGTLTVTQVRNATITTPATAEGTTAAIDLPSTDGDYGAAGYYYDYVITKPAVGGVPGRVSFRVDAPGCTSDTDTVDVVPQIAIGSGRGEVAYQNASTVTPAFYTWAVKVWDANNVELVANSDLTMTLEESVNGATPTTSPITVSRDTVNNWFGFSLTRNVGSIYRVVVTITARSDTQKTVLYYTLPSYASTAGVTGAPRFATCTINHPNGTGGTDGTSVELRYTLGDAPSGATVNAVLMTNGTGSPLVGTLRVLNGVSTGDVIATGRPPTPPVVTGRGSGGVYLTLYTITGTVILLDSTGNELSRRAIPTTQYWGA